MIPALGLMIGAYIVLRCLEIFCRSKESFSSDMGRFLVRALTLVVALLTFIETVEILLAGSSATAILR